MVSTIKRTRKKPKATALRNWLIKRAVPPARLEKIVIDKRSHRVEHSGPNRQINDCFQPNGKVFHDGFLSIAVCWVPGSTPHTNTIKTGINRKAPGYDASDRKGLNEENAVVLVASQSSGV